MRRRIVSGGAGGGGLGFGRKLQQALARNQRIAAEVSRVLDATRRAGADGGDKPGEARAPKPPRE